MNAENYKLLKEKVISLDNTALFNLFEILIDEMNHRKIKIEVTDDADDTGEI